ncbi:hypothetical protein GCM10020369_33230 [Cryptosporangium minutisporangium]|uniref:ABC transporter type 1 GsiC-like N-terminal domain-containing protein n=1 Tax=Cryptosporangium minutisporangium TaxID=113569 RepID=A0ABP6SXV9_9ACTN
MANAAVYAPPLVSSRAALAGIRVRRALGRTLITVARSLAIVVPVFLVATFVAFGLRALSGLSPAHLQLGEEATPAAVDRIEHEWGLDEPFLVQYWNWLNQVLHGDLGRSWSNGVGISQLIAEGLAISLSVATLAMIIGVVFGFALGTLAALRRTTWIDRAITSVLTVFSVCHRSWSASCSSRSSRSGWGGSPRAVTCRSRSVCRPGSHTCCYPRSR